MIERENKRGVFVNIKNTKNKIQLSYNFKNLHTYRVARPLIIDKSKTKLIRSHTVQHREHHSRSNQRKTNKYIKFAGCEECRHYRNSKDARIRIVFPMRLSEKRCQIRSYRICDIISASVCLLASKEPLILIVRTSFGEVSPELDAGTEA